MGRWGGIGVGVGWALGSAGRWAVVNAGVGCALGCGGRWAGLGADQEDERLDTAGWAGC